VGILNFYNMKKLFIILISLTLGLYSCTDNIRAKAYGGTMTVDVPKGMKVTNITWKQGDLWYSYRPMREGELPEKTIFVEESTYGVMEGKVIFNETK
jgi:hypothetical protein